MDVPEELGMITKKLERKVANYLKEASSEKGCNIPLVFAELLIEEGLVKVIEDLSSTWTMTSGNDVIYGLTDSGRELYDKLVVTDHYKTRS